MWKLAHLLLLSAVLRLNFCNSNEKIISIENGKIVGETHEDFYAYRGIPYAESPVGELRFSPPKKFTEKWNGVKSFKTYGPSCSQYSHFGYVYEGVEDCLTLNIFVPKAVAQSDEKAPVIVHIHGGAFMFGGGEGFLPENIMKAQNMILITINYRLGILGFLSTEDGVIPGNFGLKDQVEALRWIQRNIASFNGDPKKVTIVGFSAGGASVQLQYMSPLSDGLFNNGISHSGVAIDPWVMVENSREKAHQIAKFMNCPQDHKKLLKCLRGKPAEELVTLAKKFQPYLYNPYSPFGVVVEPPSASAFLTDHPKNLLKSGNFKKLPWLLSQTQDEGLYPAAEFYNEKCLKEINDGWDELSPFILDFNGTTTNTEMKLLVSQHIRKHYLGNLEISKENFLAFDDILTDRLFKHGAHKAIQLQSQFSPSYFYHFRYKSLSAFAEFMAKTKDYIGVSHGEDVLLIYGHTLRDFDYSEEEMAVGRRLIDLYFNFAKYDSAVYGNVKIEPAKPNDVKCLEISSLEDYKMVHLGDEFGRVKFWDKIEKVLASKDGIRKRIADEL